MNLVQAIKENKDGVRTKLIVATTITVGVITTAIVLSKMKDNLVDVVLVTPEAAEALIEAPTE